MKHASAMLFAIFTLLIKCDAQEADSLSATLREHLSKQSKLFREKLATPEALAKLADETASKIDVDKLTLAQAIQLTISGVTASKPFSEKVVKRLDAFKDSGTAQGAAAKFVCFHVMASSGIRSTGELRTLLDSALKHKGLPDLINSDQAMMVFLPIGAYLRKNQPEAVAYLPKVLPLLSNVNSPLGPGGAAWLMSLWQAADTAYKTKPTAREESRLAIVGAMERAYAATRKTDPSMNSRYERWIELLSGPATTGKLIGSKSPELSFLWTSIAGAKSISDLKGKVVVIDFWATWCGPCLASFPKLRELQEKYKDKDVVILGVTSIQGRHHGPDGVVDCRDNAAKEMALMPEFMHQKQMTWQVAFTKQDVFNGAFGVEGIPHVAIIDANGVVRYNGLDAESLLSDKSRLIDDLLKEKASK